jgi:spore germination protein KA
MEAVTRAALEAAFRQCEDFTARPISLGGGPDTAWLFFLDGLVSGGSIAEEIIRPLTERGRFSRPDDGWWLENGGLWSYTAKRRDDPDDVRDDLLRGWCAVIPPGADYAVDFEVRSQERRSIDAPKEEKVVKGAKDAFIEQVRTNTALVRRKIRSADLKIVEVPVGRQTGSVADVIWLSGTAPAGMPEEVCRRLGTIDTEGVLAPANVEEFLVDQPGSPFPQLLTTERPDRFCINLMEGKVGVLVDGLPLGFLAPGTFSQYLKTPEDYSGHFLVTSILTLLRYFSLLLTLLLPAFYVSVAMYHQEMIPAKLMQSMIDAKQSVPFPTAVEVLAMLVSFELIQEAGLRLPSPIGETVSIIGALIVGQSAVEAKVVSPVVVVVVALAGIAGYTMPDQEMGAAMRVCRFLLVAASIAFGLYGICAGTAAILYHLCSLECYNVPYLTPFTGKRPHHLSRAFLRGPLRQGTKAASTKKPEASA